MDYLQALAGLSSLTSGRSGINMSARVAHEEHGRRSSFDEPRSFNKVQTIPAPIERHDGERIMDDISGKRGSSSSSDTFSDVLSHMAAHPEDATVQCAGFAAILALLKDDFSALSSDLDVSKLCIVVTDTMGRFAVDAAVQLAACKVVQALLKEPHFSSETCTESANSFMPAVITAMGNHWRDSDLQFVGCSIIAEAYRGHSTSLELNPRPVLKSAMQRYQNRADIQVMAMTALIAVEGSSSTATDYLFRDFDTAAHIMQILGDNDCSSDVRHAAVKLAMLTSNTCDGLAKLQAVNGSNVVLAGMATDTDDAGIQAIYCDLLSKLLANNMSVSDRGLKETRISVLQVMSAHTESDTVQQSGLSLLTLIHDKLSKKHDVNTTDITVPKTSYCDAVTQTDDYSNTISAELNEARLALILVSMAHGATDVETQLRGCERLDSLQACGTDIATSHVLLVLTAALHRHVDNAQLCVAILKIMQPWVELATV